MAGQTVLADAPLLEPMAIPRHLAIIMDGNGRWALERNLSRTQGHKQGVEAVRKTVENASALEIEYLTLFGFSSENWSRPQEEVQDLMRLLKLFVCKNLTTLIAKNVRILVIGEREGLGADVVELLEDAQYKTRENTGLTLTIAFNYGARQELVSAVKNLAKEVATGDLKPEDINEMSLSRHLYAGDIPDPDLIVRTSGEQRLSNFLLWQAAYSEFVFVDCYWPDFDRHELEMVLVEFGRRNRRFGGLASQTGSSVA